MVRTFSLSENIAVIFEFTRCCAFKQTQNHYKWFWYGKNRRKCFFTLSKWCVMIVDVVVSKAKKKLVSERDEFFSQKMSFYNHFFLTYQLLTCLFMVLIWPDSNQILHTVGSRSVTSRHLVGSEHHAQTSGSCSSDRNSCSNRKHF